MGKISVSLWFDKSAEGAMDELMKMKKLNIAELKAAGER